MLTYKFFWKCLLWWIEYPLTCVFHVLCQLENREHV